MKNREDQENKKLCLATLALEFWKKQVRELEEHSVVLLFTNEPRGFDSELAMEVFAMRQKAVINKMRSEQSGCAIAVWADVASTD